MQNHHHHVRGKPRPTRPFLLESPRIDALYGLEPVFDPATQSIDTAVLGSFSESAKQRKRPVTIAVTGPRLRIFRAISGTASPARQRAPWAQAAALPKFSAIVWSA